MLLTSPHPSAVHRNVPGEPDLDLIRLSNGPGLAILLHPNGAPYAFRHGRTLINRALVSSAEMGWFRLLARLTPLDGGASEVLNLLNPVTSQTFGQASPEACQWAGISHETEVRVTLQLAPDSLSWTWTIDSINRGNVPKTLEIFYGQDLGLGDESAVRNNEAYLSQYLDHHIEDSSTFGPVLMTRQNMPMDGDRHPWIAQGCRERTAAYCSDGFQFFGLPAKSGEDPLALTGTGLPSKVRQFEFAYVGLQSKPVDLEPGCSTRTTFFAIFDPHHPGASCPEDLDGLAGKLEFLDQAADESVPQVSSRSGKFSLVGKPPLNGRCLDQSEIEANFPGERRSEERDVEGQLLSFFHGDDRHVVTGLKETRMERAHGHILWGSSRLDPDARALGTTVYANGIFNAQTYFANPNFGRFLSVVRCPLNQLRLNGQRIFIEVEEEWRQLGIPSTFEMGPRFARWLYQLPDRTLEITVWCDSSYPACYLDVSVVRGPASRILVTHQLVPGGNEFSAAIDLSIDHENACAIGVPRPPAAVLDKIPGYGFLIAAADPDNVASISTELPGSVQSSHPGFLTVQSSTTESMTVILVASDGGVAALSEVLPELRATALAGFQEPLDFRDSHAGGLRLDAGATGSRSRLNEIIPWYAHNAWVHFATPHGLEQYNGGAWGVRDVCQGSVEWLLAVGQTNAVRGILKTVFTQQYRVDPVWPQWFMLPPFGKIQQPHAHGDIPFWPLKALCDYLEVTEDYALLELPLLYTSAETFEPEAPAETVKQHVDRIFDHYHSRCVPGTALVNYGDGDWDDTLQPADPVLRSSMVSTWTVALSYHAFRQYRDVCLATGQTAQAGQLTGLLARIAADFRQHLMPGGITCGFAIVESDGRFRPLLHPDDQTSGIRYRLLPMTRAILAGLFTREEAERHLQLIEEHLLYPDGVHLMSDPVPYRGGISHQFKRAETAAFFGREVGLQYVHAHIRYAEALAEMGRADEAWQALSTVNPVGLRSCVPNASIRQANAYFSSSDAEFPDRYQARERFAELQDGRIPVSGGWRIYSSGPGIFLHKLVTRLVGMRERHGYVIFDPLIPAGQSDLVLRRKWRGHNLEIKATRNSHGKAGILVNGSSLPNVTREQHAYRIGGQRVPTTSFLRLLDAGLNRVEIHTHS